MTDHYIVLYFIELLGPVVSRPWNPANSVASTEVEMPCCIAEVLCVKTSVRFPFLSLILFRLDSSTQVVTNLKNSELSRKHVFQGGKCFSRGKN